MRHSHRSFARRHPILSLAIVGGIAATTGAELVAAGLVGGAMALLLMTPEAAGVASSVVQRGKSAAHHMRERMQHHDGQAAEPMMPQI